MLRELKTKIAREKSNKKTYRENMFSVYLEIDVAERLRNVAEKNKLAVSQIVNDSLKDYFKNNRH